MTFAFLLALLAAVSTLAISYWGGFAVVKHLSNGSVPKDDPGFYRVVCLLTAIALLDSAVHWLDTLASLMK